MKIKKHLFKLATLSVAFSLGIGLAINANTSHQEVDAAQYAYNYAPYTYSGNYYKDIDFSATGGMNGELRQSLSELIYPAGFYSYSGNDTGTLSEQLQQADEDPNNNSNMVMFYTRDSITKTWANPGVEVWNREHVWCQSLSNDNWGTSKGGTDILHLRPTYKSTNSTRNNHPYGNVVDKVSKTYNNMFYGYLEDHGDLFEPLDCVKGDVARIIMYVWTTYNNSSKPLNIKSVFESYDTLLQWHTMDKPDELEGHRNDYCQNQSKQKNRNPFVDHPELGWKIFGDMAEHVSYKNDCMAAYPENGGGTPIEPTGISLNRTTGSVQAGSSLQLNATLQPSGATGTVTWSSDDTDVATVNGYGLVTGVSAGTATITANVTSYSASCEITVTSNGGGGGGGNTGDYVKVASYDFGSTGTSSNATYSTDNLSQRFANSVQTGTGLSNIVTGITSATNVYPGYSGYDSYGLKLGSSGSNGSFTATLDRQVSRAIIKTAAWGTTDTVSVGGADAQTPGVAYSSANSIKTLTFDFDESDNVTFVYAKRGFIQTIDFYATGEVADNPRNHLNNAMQVSYLAADETVAGTESAIGEITFASLNLENGVQYLDPFTIAEGVTVTFSGGDNDGKYYDNGSGIRTYGNGSFTVACGNGITQIELIFSGSNKPSANNVVDTGSYNSDTSIWTGSANSVTFTRPSGSGHWRLQKITVTYGGQSVTVDNVKMRFGAAIPVEDWYDIEASWDVDCYGVMFLKYDTLHDAYGYSSIEEAYEGGIRPRADVHTNEGDMPLPLNGLLIFTARINMTSELNYGVVYVAAPYIVIDGTHYFLEEMEYSVNSIAQEYLDNDLDSTLSNAALTKLATPIPQGD